MEDDKHLAINIRKVDKAVMTMNGIVKVKEIADIIVGGILCKDCAVMEETPSR